MSTNTPGPTTYVNQLEALKLIEKWSVWMIGIETAMLGAIGYLGLAENPWVAAAVICAIVSMLMATLVLTGLPSIATRLDPARNLYSERIHLFPVLQWFRLWVVCMLQHLLFAAVLVLVGVAMVLADVKKKPDGSVDRPYHTATTQPHDKPAAQPSDK